MSKFGWLEKFIRGEYLNPSFKSMFVSTTAILSGKTAIEQILKTNTKKNPMQHERHLLRWIEHLQL